MKTIVSKCRCCKKKISLTTITPNERVERLERERQAKLRAMTFTSVDEMREIARRHSRPILTDHNGLPLPSERIAA